MFSQLLRFEILYQLKQRAFPIFALLFLLIGASVGSQNMTPANINFNAGYQINFYASIFTLSSVFFVMFFAISGMLRDKQHHMQHLIYSTSIKKHHFFFSRFLGVFIFSLFAFTPYLIGAAFGVSFANLDPSRLASFNIMLYVQPWLLFVFPNILICSTLIFAVSTLTKSNIATYVSSIFIYVLYMMSSMFLNSPIMAHSAPASAESMIMAALADPFGVSAFFEQTQYWTPYQKNTQLLSFSGLFMWNRIIWIAFSFIVLLITYRLFSFKMGSKKAKNEKVKNEKVIQTIHYITVQTKDSIKTQLKAFYALLKIELNGVFKSLPFLAILMMWLIIVFSEMYTTIIGGGQYGDSLYPFSNLLIELFVESLTTFSIILIVFYSAELVWRERSFNFSTIIDATPIANWIFFFSKFITLILLPMLLIFSAILMAIGFQIANGYFNFEIEQYLLIFYYQGLKFIVLAMLALFIQTTIPNKYFGMGFTALGIILWFKSPIIGVEHPLLSFGTFPTPTYSNMIGYSGEIKLFNHLSLYWVAFGGVLSLLSFKLWQRGIITTFKINIKQLGYYWKKRELITLTLLVVVFLAIGSTIFYNTNIVNKYMTASDNLDYREAYERKFKQYDNLESLYAIAIKTKVDLFPNENSYSVKADYVIKNKGENEISQLFITERIPLKSIYLEYATLIEHDTLFGTYLFHFKVPIHAQQELKYSYELTKSLDGYETDRAIVKNGSYITHRDFQPILSYRNNLEITNNYEREKRNLPKLVEEVITDSHLTLEDEKMGRVSYETLISTQSDEIAIGSGNLVKQWSEKGRNYYQYKPKQKIIPAIAYFSSNYKMKTTDFKGVKIEHYFNSEHDFNINTIEESIKQTLVYCMDNFGNYNRDYIRIAEIPSHWPFGGFAHPGVISMVEDQLYLSDVRNTEVFSLVAKRTIHEVAHQWWGHILTPKVIEGGSLFTEGFAKYTEAMVMEKIYGKRAVYQLSQTANRRYFSGRAFASSVEPPLYMVDEEGYLAYGKNYTVMLALRDLIGEDTVNQVLQTLVTNHHDEAHLNVNSLEFLDELYSVSLQEHHILIDDWFKNVITYNLSVEDATHKQLEDDTFEISFTINAKRFKTIESDEVIPIEINEPITIGLFSKHPNAITKEDIILYLKPHQINKETMEFKIIVDKLPKYISIDPFGTRSDENFEDNIIGF